jgi:hypothetical protein
VNDEAETFAVHPPANAPRESLTCTDPSVPVIEPSSIAAAARSASAGTLMDSEPFDVVVVVATVVVVVDDVDVVTSASVVVVVPEPPPEVVVVVGGAVVVVVLDVVVVVRIGSWAGDGAANATVAEARAPATISALRRWAGIALSIGQATEWVRVPE